MAREPKKEVNADGSITETHYFRDTGTLMLETRYVDGVAQGVSTQYYECTARKLREVNYVDDKIQGLVREWNEYGEEEKPRFAVDSNVFSKDQFSLMAKAMNIPQEKVDELFKIPCADISCDVTGHKDEIVRARNNQQQVAPKVEAAAKKLG